MKRLKFLLSTKVTLLLLLAFATAMAVATFMENDHGTDTARAMVYEAWWFELIIGWLAINFLAVIRKYRLFTKEKWPIGLFHFAFVIIIVGAFVTRYFGSEGLMHIREKQETHVFYSYDNYLQLKNMGSDNTILLQEKSKVTGPTFQAFSTQVEAGDTFFKIKVMDYIEAAKQSFVDGDNTYLKMVVSTNEGRQDILMQEGEEQSLDKLKLSINQNPKSDITVFRSQGTWKLKSSIDLKALNMATQQSADIASGSMHNLQEKTLYQWKEGAFIVQSIHENSELIYHTATKPDPQATDVVHYMVEDQAGVQLTEDYVEIVSIAPDWKTFDYEGKQYAATFGPKASFLPYRLYLSDFEMNRYPGSHSPSDYASQVEVRDGNEVFDYSIYMNHVLDYKGYRFYQSSYDQDEQGTVLSINQDRPGTLLTYLGYFLLSLGMFITLFTRGSRFSMLNKSLKKMQKPHITILAIIGFCLLNISSLQAQEKSDIAHTLVPEYKAQEFGELIVQDRNGRMKPLNTTANELVRKLSGKSYMPVPLQDGTIRLTPEQFLLAVQLDPYTFGNLPVIKIDQEKSLAAFQALGIEPTPHLSFRQFLDSKGNYKLAQLVEKAHKLNPSKRNEGQNELLKTDERFNIFYSLLSQNIFRLFPLHDEPNNTWYTQHQAAEIFHKEEKKFVSNIVPLYLQHLAKGIKEGDWTKADQTLGYISNYQQKIGSAVYPSVWDQKIELLYNQLNLGTKLFGPFWLLGIIMLLLAIVFLFYENKKLSIAWKTGAVLSWLGLGLFTLHLGMRWYIAKHPPWSDGFEMLIFVAWSLLLFGLLFVRKSHFTLPLGLLFSATLLFVGFLDWLNPEITNLAPVLNSYWLKIHVAIIVGSYAPLAMSAVIGLLCLVLLIFQAKQPQAKWKRSMKELTTVNEMSMTIGLFLLTVGTFLGGVWANESWGRYWAWDPKETWALISVIVYAIVLHLRLIPSLRSHLIFNMASLWAFSAIIMTSFGVNYYLSGLHSYAKGDAVPVPGWVYWAVAILVAISIGAIYRQRKRGR